jgi:DNA replication and repair protein RecF
VFLTNLKIRNFRNISKLDLEFTDLINYIYSPNGTGKTNLLEAIQCVSVGKTLRAETENELINFNNTQKDKSLHVSGKFTTSDNLKFAHTYYLEVDKKAFEEKLIKKKKTLLINKSKVSINEFIGRVPSIWFSPESIKIITSSPLNKRKYFDDILIQLYPDYNFHLKSYNRSLKQRNKLLQDDFLNPNQIRIWTEQVIKYGAKIISARRDFFSLLNKYLMNLDEITRYKFQVLFKPNIKISEIFAEDIAHRFREELRKNFEKDKYLKTTSMGPHRDDWQMLINLQPGTFNLQLKQGEFIQASKFASRGQQRMALIILQMVLIKMFEKNLETKPVMLLDDIFSELDHENEEILLDFITKNNIQSFITGVDKKEFKNIHQQNLSSKMKL